MEANWNETVHICPDTGDVEGFTKTSGSSSSSSTRPLSAAALSHWTQLENQNLVNKGVTINSVFVSSRCIHWHLKLLGLFSRTLMVRLNFTSCCFVVTAIWSKFGREKKLYCFSLFFCFIVSRAAEGKTNVCFLSNKTDFFFLKVFSSTREMLKVFWFEKHKLVLFWSLNKSALYIKTEEFTSQFCCV